MVETLPDYLCEGLEVVFIGLNPSAYSARVGHYFANPHNRFWPALNRSGLVPEELSAERDYRLLHHKIGLTDVVKRVTSQAVALTPEDFRHWAPILKGNLERYRPLVACFHGPIAYRGYLRCAEGHRARDLTLGAQDHTIGSSRVFLVPNPSPANARYSLDDLAGWYRELGAFLGMFRDQWSESEAWQRR